MFDSLYKSDTGKAAKGTIDTIIGWFEGADLKQIPTILSRKVMSGITGDLPKLLQSLNNPVEKQLQRTFAYWNDLTKQLRVYVSGVTDGVGIAAQKLIAILTSLKDSALNTVSGFSSSIKEGFIRSINDATIGLEELTSTISSKISTVASAFSVDLFESGYSLVTTFAGGVSAAIDSIFAIVVTAFDKVWDLFPQSDAKAGPFSNLTASGSSLVYTFVNGILSTKDYLASSISDIFGNALDVSAITAEAGSLYEIGFDAVSNIANGILDARDSIAEAIDSLSDYTLGGMQSLALAPTEINLDSLGDISYKYGDELKTLQFDLGSLNKKAAVEIRSTIKDLVNEYSAVPAHTLKSVTGYDGKTNLTGILKGMFQSAYKRRQNPLGDEKAAGVLAAKDVKTNSISARMSFNNRFFGREGTISYDGKGLEQGEKRFSEFLEKIKKYEEWKKS